MPSYEDFKRTGEGLESLNGTLETTENMVSGFDQALDGMRKALAETAKDMSAVERGLNGGLRKAFDGVVFDGMKLSDALRTVAQSMSKSVYTAAINPVMKGVSGAISSGIGSLIGGILPFEKGAPFSQGKVMPFAQGGVVSGATTFPMRGGTGLMGEAGPEAIMPLARGPDGKLGVRGGGGGGVSVVMNISTPDVQGFQRSQSQIAAQMSRALSSGNRNR